MIFSHFPAGYITAKITEKKFWKNFSRIEILWLYAIILFFSIFPDIDLFYFYFINGINGHHENLTHSFFLYIFIALIVYFLGTLKKNRFIKYMAFSIVLGATSHLVLDSLFSCVKWIWPIRNGVYGLPLITSYFNILNQYGIGFYLFVELFIIFLAISIYICEKLSKKNGIIMLIFFLIFSFVSAYLALDNFYMQPNICYRDLDNDCIPNVKDFDSDNDGIENILDTDANNNGISNKEEILTHVKQMEGKYSNILHGEFWHNGVSWGLVSDTAVLKDGLEKAGIFLSTEISRDFEKDPKLYEFKQNDSPVNVYFSDKINNIYSFLRNKNMLIFDGATCKKLESLNLEPADIIFYGSNLIHIAIVVDTKEESYQVLEIENYYKKAVILDNWEMERYYGVPIAVARLP
ncbi:metal-dependent hydrolase [Patescibacteria group bacterium]